MNSNPAPESNTIDPQEKSSLESKMQALDQRMNHLEHPERGRFERLQKRTSFLALLIGILLSAISLFDIFWNQPRNELFRDMEEFNKSVNAVSNLRQNMIQIQYQSNNPTHMANDRRRPSLSANGYFFDTFWRDSLRSLACSKRACCSGVSSASGGTATGLRLASTATIVK